MNKTIKERIAVNEAHLIDLKDDMKIIKKNVVSKHTINIMKWAIGGVATLALSALLIAASSGGV
jgi:pyridoxal biosynthesis lyase PdxS